MEKIPGFRFHPTDVELVKYFLKRKVMGKKFALQVISEIDVYQYAPWDLPDKSCMRCGDLEWYFFCPRIGGRKYGGGLRANRATRYGYWKATGKDRVVQHCKKTVGMIKTLVFHTGKAPGGDRTDWVMHEYRLEDEDLIDMGVPQDSYVICKIFKKEGLGPRNSAHYGRQFNEEDWGDEQEETPSAVLSATVSTLNMTCDSSQSEQHLPVPSDLSSPMSPEDSYVTMTSDSSQSEQHLPASVCIEPASVSCLSVPSDPLSAASPEENFAESTLSSEFFEGLGDLDDWSALSGYFGDLDYVQMIDMDFR